jgi:hypothetical protein
MRELDEMLEALKRLSSPDVVAPMIAAEAAPLILQAAQRTASNGSGPDGEVWAPSKSGNPIYVNAAKKITVNCNGRIVGLTVTGGEAMAQIGTHKLPQRLMIPEVGDTPQSVNDAITVAAEKVIRKLGGAE